MIASIALGLLLVRGPAVTFETRAVRVKDALSAISAKMHTVLAASPELSNLFLVVSVHDVDGDVLKAKLAEALDAKWQPYAGGDRLVVDHALLEARARAAVAERTKSIAAALSQIQERLDKLGPFDRAQAVGLLGMMEKVDQAYDEGNVATREDPVAVFRYRAPAQRAAMRVITSFDPYELASLPPGITAYSDRPTRLERKLSPAIADAIQQLQKEQAAWCDVYRGDAKFEARRQSWTADPRHYKDPLDPKAVRCFCKVTVQGGGMPYINVYFVNAAGDVLMFGETTLPGQAAQTASPAPVEADQDFLVPEDVTDEADFFGLHNFGESKPFDAAFRAVITHPEDHEPLSLAPSSVLLAAANQSKTNLIACVPDDAFQVPRAAFDKGKPGKISRIWGRMRSFCGLAKSEGWLVFYPRTIQEPTDRPALGRFLRAVDETGGMRLATLSEFAAQLSDNRFPDLVYLEANALVPNVTQLADWNLDSARFYGLLTPANRADLYAGKALGFRDVPQAARDALYATLIGSSYSELRRIDQNGQPIYRKGLTIENEPAEALAEGFDPAGQFNMVVRNHLGVLASAESPYGRMSNLRTMSLNSLAIQMLIPEMPQLKSYDQLQGRPMQGVIPGKDTDLDLSFMLRPNLQYQMHLSDHDYDLRSKFITLDSLPENFKRELAADTERARKTYKNDGGR